MNHTMEQFQSDCFIMQEYITATLDKDPSVRVNPEELVLKIMENRQFGTHEEAVSYQGKLSQFAAFCLKDNQYQNTAVNQFERQKKMVLKPAERYGTRLVGFTTINILGLVTGVSALLITALVIIS